jgi:hypothetical protein
VEGDEVDPKSPVGARQSEAADESDTKAEKDAQDVIEAFRRKQRLLTGIDTNAITAFQRSNSNLAVFQETQRAVADSIARSIDFAQFQAATDRIQSVVASAATESIRRSVSANISRTFNQSALDAAALAMGRNAEILGKVYSDQLLSISRTLDLSKYNDRVRQIFETVEWGALRQWIIQWRPANLRRCSDMGTIASIALDEGIPLAYIPGDDIVEELVAASGRDDRIAILQSRQAEILRDCEASLEHVEHPWADHCLSAIAAMKALETEWTAQSHAANIIDTIVLATLGNGARDRAKSKAKQPLDELSLDVIAENLVVRPLFLGLFSWWPGRGQPTPEHFSRHPTAHAVGYPGVFSSANGLIAVMLATSMTIQFSSISLDQA